MMAVGEVDVFFVEDGCPLKRSSMKLLTGRAMAVLRIQRLLPTQLVADFTAMTAGLIASVKVWVVVVDIVGCPMLPFIVLAFGVSSVAIVTVRTVCRCLFGHDSSVGVGLKCIETRQRSGCWTESA